MAVVEIRCRFCLVHKIMIWENLTTKIHNVNMYGEILEYMEISLKLESMPTLCRSAFLPADTTITRRVAATIEVAPSVVHWKEYCFRGIKNNNILPAPQQLTREPL